MKIGNMRKEKQIKLIKITFLWALVIGCMMMIFRFSSQIATDSNTLSTEVTEKFLERVVPSYHQMDSTKQSLLIKKTNHYIRKAAHFSIYLLLGIFLYGLFAFYQVYLKKRIAYSLLVGLVYAISDEVHQIFISGRGPQFGDVCIDFSGLLIGVTLCALVRYLKGKLKKHISLTKLEGGI